MTLSTQHIRSDFFSIPTTVQSMDVIAQQRSKSCKVTEQADNDEMRPIKIIDIENLSDNGP